MAASQEYLMVATGGPKVDKNQLFQGVSTSRNAVRGKAWKLEVPDGVNSLAFNSFDELSRLTDDLVKSDQQVDSIVHRLERQILEMSPAQKFIVKVDDRKDFKQEVAFEEYISQWQWDAKKFPIGAASVTVGTVAEGLMKSVNSIDEDVRKRAQAYNEVKMQKTSVAKKESAALQGRDLVDVLTPGVVAAFEKGQGQAFAYTQHFTTVCVMLPKGGEKEFLDWYETGTGTENTREEKTSEGHGFPPDAWVVPGSAQKFDVDDKDGNSIWRVVIFKAALELFKKACRERRFTVRDFEYSQETYAALQAQRVKVEKDENEQKDNVLQASVMAWSDLMVSWTHVKVMRVYVESVLRYGIEPQIAAYVLAPIAAKVVPLRLDLARILGNQGAPLPYKHVKGEAGNADEEDNYPYVSVAMTPFAAVKG